MIPIRNTPPLPAFSGNQGPANASHETTGASMQNDSRSGLREITVNLGAEGQYRFTAPAEFGQTNMNPGKINQLLDAFSAALPHTLSRVPNGKKGTLIFCNSGEHGKIFLDINGQGQLNSLTCTQTGDHQHLFAHVASPSFVMTSSNRTPGWLPSLSAANPSGIGEKRKAPSPHQIVRAEPAQPEPADTSSAAQSSNRGLYSSQLPPQSKPGTTADENLFNSRLHASSSASVQKANLVTELRQADAGDLVKIHEFILDLDEETYKKRFGDFEEMPTESACNVMSLKLTTEPEPVFVAYRNGAVIGMTDYCDEYHPAHEKGTVARSNMVVHQDYQGKGVGKKLLDIRDQHMRDHGYKWKSGGVYRENTEQIARLLRNGYVEDIEEYDEEYMQFIKQL